MSRKDDSLAAGGSSSSSSKKLRFYMDSYTTSPGFETGRIDELFDDLNERRKLRNGGILNEDSENQKKEVPSFMDFMKIELTRGYILEHDEERYSARRQKIYSFMKIPREVEKFMAYGVIQCADSFLYILTFLPIRYILALWGLIYRSIGNCLGLRRRTQRLLAPAEICDLLKGTIWIICSVILLSVDTNRFYHIIKSQSIIKLYIFFNMLEVGDRLLSAFGQDTIDALFWTATEPRNKKREHFGLVPHLLFALIYVILHTILIMFQMTTLNVAVNSNNKGLLTIMMSNNFVELKGSVFKKFDKNNLFQLTCSDVRERFHLSVLLFIVAIQTMKEFNWSMEQIYILLPDCFYVLITEVLIDWIKHAFITRFNELPVDVYREYTISLAYDMTQTRQKHAFSDHSDLVARRMGFIPFPLGVVLIKAIYTTVSFDNFGALVLCVLTYFTLMACRILNTICALGKACDLMKQHQEGKSNSSSTPTQSSLTNTSPVMTATAGTSTVSGTVAGSSQTMSAGVKIPSPITPLATKIKRVDYYDNTSSFADTSLSSSSSPLSFSPLLRSQTVDIVITTKVPKSNFIDSIGDNEHNTSITNNLPISEDESECSKLKSPDTSLGLGATAIFSNSDVDLGDVCLNENILNGSAINDEISEDEQQVTRSVPDLQQETISEICSTNETGQHTVPSSTASSRTHKRSESEPSIQSMLGAEKENPS